MTEPIDISSQREAALTNQVNAVRAQRAVILEFLNLARKLADACDMTERLAQVDLSAIHAERARLASVEDSKKEADKKKPAKRTTKGKKNDKRRKRA